MGMLGCRLCVCGYVCMCAYVCVSGCMSRMCTPRPYRPLVVLFLSFFAFRPDATQRAGNTMRAARTTSTHNEIHLLYGRGLYTIPLLYITCQWMGRLFTDMPSAPAPVIMRLNVPHGHTWHWANFFFTYSMPGKTFFQSWLGNGNPKNKSMTKTQIIDGRRGVGWVLTGNRKTHVLLDT